MQTSSSREAFEKLSVSAQLCFSAVPSRVPPPEANGLKTISRTNCLSVASFRSAGFHLFVSGNPRSGQGFGCPLFAYFIWASK